MYKSVCCIKLMCVNIQGIPNGKSYKEAGLGLYRTLTVRLIFTLFRFDNLKYLVTLVSKTPASMMNNPNIWFLLMGLLATTEPAITVTMGLM